MRLMLAALIVLAQVVGPWPCCCRVVITAPVAVTPAPEPACPHCCPPKPADPVPAVPTPADDRPMPCCGQELTATVATPDAAIWERLLTLADWSPDRPAVAFGRMPAVNLAPWRAGVTDWPFLTTSARLYAHHALRC